MASFEDALKVISDRLDTVPLALEQSAKAVQPSLLDSVLALVGQMEVDGGNLVANSDNLALVDSVIDAVRTTLLESDYVDAVGQFAGEYDTQKRLTDEYFNEEFGTFTAEEATTLLGRSKKQAVDRLVKVEFVNTGLYDPIRTRLDAAVSSGAPLRDTIRNLRIQINGGKVSATEERLGLLNRYVKQIAYDSFAVGNREYTKNVSEELGAEWFRYVGGIIDPPETKDGKPKTSGGTRPFCEVRNNEYWHFGEIQSWVGKSGNPKPSGDWSGKVAGTDKQTIFTYLGGWNCRHSIIPVVPTRVPKERLEEAMAEGFYKPSEREKQLLGLGGETPTVIEPTQTQPTLTGFTPDKTVKGAKETSKRLLEEAGINIGKVSKANNLDLDTYNQMNAQLTQLVNDYNLEGWSGDRRVDLNYKGGNGYAGRVTFFELPNETRLKAIDFGNGSTSPKFGELGNRGTVPNFSIVDDLNANLETLTHEFGHLISVSEQKGISAKFTSFWDDMGKLYSEYMDELRDITIDKGAEASLEIHLGRYASTNVDEFLAEGFKEYKLRSQPSKYARLIGELIDRTFKK